jgi:hypothetical protein
MKAQSSVSRPNNLRLIRLSSQPELSYWSDEWRVTVPAPIEKNCDANSRVNGRERYMRQLMDVTELGSNTQERNEIRAPSADEINIVSGEVDDDGACTW